MRCIRHGRACAEPPTVITSPAGNRYMVRQLLGSGGFARVYRVAELCGQLPADVLASNNHSDGARGESGSLAALGGSTPPKVTAPPFKHFALKVISKCRLGNSVAGREALRNEISIHQQLDHPAIVKLITFWEDQYRIYLLMHIIGGPTLEHYVTSRGKLSEPEAATYAAQIMEALSYLHANKIVHRDIKPANFLLSQDLCTVHLCDFGLAAHADSLKDSASQPMCGTPNFVAPELLTPASIGRHAKKVLPPNFKASKAVGHTPSADLWSMGVALYTMLTGSGPFDSEDLTRTFRRIRTARFTFPIGLKLSANAKALIRQLLTEDYTRRPSADDALQHPFFATREIASTRRPAAAPEKKLEHSGRSRIVSSSKRELIPIKDRERDARLYSTRRNDPVTGSQRRVSSMHREGQRISNPQDAMHGAKERGTQRCNDRRLAKAAGERTASLNSNSPYSTSSRSERRRSHADRRSSLASRALHRRKRESVDVTSSGKRASLLPSHARSELTNLSLLISTTLLRGRKYLDDDKSGRSQVDRKARFDSVTKEVDGGVNAPPLVRRWLDYTSKYGFATLMEDGRIGCCFNDGSIMFFVSEPSEIPDVAYVPPRGKTVNVKNGQYEDPSAEMSKKACLCTLFADMILDGGRGSMYDLPSACNVSFLNSDTDTSAQLPNKPSEDFKGIAHVREWARFRNFRATAFRLSNNNIHVKFDVGGDYCDDYVFNPTESTLFYREAKTGAAWVCPVKYLGEFSSHSEYMYAQLQVCSQAVAGFVE